MKHFRISVPQMRRVFLESPYRGKGYENLEIHLKYASAAIADCLKRSEAPFASHVLYTGSLKDRVPEERDRGIRAGFMYRWVTEATVVYTDLGISDGMAEGIAVAELMGHPIEYRTIEGWTT